MNMNLYGHDEQWLMVDCGASFKEPLTAVSNNYKQRNAEQNSDTLFDIVSADPGFIADQKERLVGLIITHAHEDHIGAVAHLWPRLKCPVYTTPFTAICLRRKLNEKGIADQVKIIEVASGDFVDIGVFNVQWLALTHSLPEPHAIVIRTRVAKVFHTGDWKIDNTPVIGEPFSESPFKQLARESIDAMVCDSTNANRPGKTVSEGSCYKGLKHVIDQCSGKVVVCCFGSNIARLITLIKIAKQCRRYAGLIGRSLMNMVANARLAGFWPSDFELITPYDLAYLPDKEVLLIATGSQGEPKAALSRLSDDKNKDIALNAGDTVIFSSIIIPGNEEAVETLVTKLKAKNINVIMQKDVDAPIHASGHPSQEDLEELYSWVKPRLVIPTHGEAEHLIANADIAKTVGISRQLTGFNGDLFEIKPVAKVRKNFTTVARLPLER
ncbi:ribonuclease J [Aliikangiella marina]|uniref:Ribonuclease J n=1 Tax=Aliikangiella marina TaxID=1712262 RepID=A0A545TJB0_9GAMM|nr:ribonuclease J [Aliikangiella marina]TQV77251.1 ribonuclease J [Aliikangiella marina]